MPPDIENLLVVLGSAKAGTTSLAAWLGTHNKIVLGRNKEPRYFTDFAARRWTGPGSDLFAKSIPTDMTSYRENFAGLAPGMWALDASTDYIWNEASLERIKEFSRNHRVKAIVVVRDPVERAISEYNHTLRHNWEKLSFAESIAAEPDRFKNGYIPLFLHDRRSRVYHDIMRALDIFGSDLLILDYNDLINKDNLAEIIFRFLKIKQIPLADLERKNQSLIPRNMLARTILNSSTLRWAARIFAPSDLRHRVWKNLHVSSNRLKTVSDREIIEFQEQLVDEIRLCEASALIPTANWTCTQSYLNRTRNTFGSQ